MYCQKCGAELQDGTNACPQCGIPQAVAPVVATPAARKKVPWWGWVISVLVLLWIIGSLAPKDKTTALSPGQSKQGASVATSSIEVPMVSAIDLNATYQANEVKADAKYKGHQFRVKGSVVSINKDITDEPYVCLKGERGEFSLQDLHANFSKDDLSTLAELKKGQPITVLGTVDGLFMGCVILKECQLIK